MVDPSSVKFSVVPPGFEALPDIPCVEVKRARPLKVGEKRRLAQQLEGVREHLSVATFTNARFPSLSCVATFSFFVCLAARPSCLQWSGVRSFCLLQCHNGPC